MIGLSEILVMLLVMSLALAGLWFFIRLVVFMVKKANKLSDNNMN